MYRFDPGTTKLDHYTTLETDPENSLISPIINDILSHSDGSIWVGTKVGLDKIIPETGEILHINLESDQQYTYIASIIEDNDGHLWMGTQNGIIFYDPDSNFVKRYLFGLM